MSSEVVIREYRLEDRERVLDLLRLNTPKYFSPEEEKYLIYYLDHEIDYYFVLEINREVIGSGGINFSDNNTIGKISWDFLHPDFQEKGLGTLLLNYRIERLKEFKSVQKIIVRTSQLVYKFYEKSGFLLVEQVKDYWAKGFDLYLMEYASSFQEGSG